MLEARKLLRRPHRERSGTCLAEGPRVVREALDAPTHVLEIFVTGDLSENELITAARAQGISSHVVGPKVLDAISDTATPQGIVAIVEAHPIDLQDLGTQPDLVLVLAEVRDPGNAGALARSALASGASAIVFTHGSVDPFGPKTVRASAGAVFHLPMVRALDAATACKSLRSAGLSVVAASAGAGIAYDQADLTRPIAVVVGNETRGLGTDWSDADLIVNIPMAGASESLNVSVAGSILLFEAARQRRAAANGPVYPLPSNV